MASRLPVLLLVVCGTIRDCDGDAGIAAGGKAHLPLLRRFLPDHHGVAGARRLSIRINRIDPEPFFRSFPILGAGGLAGPSRKCDSAISCPSRSATVQDRESGW